VGIRDRNGNIAVLKLPDPSALETVAVGDVMDVAYTAALAIAVGKRAANDGKMGNGHGSTR